MRSPQKNYRAVFIKGVLVIIIICLTSYFIINYFKLKSKRNEDYHLLINISPPDILRLGDIKIWLSHLSEILDDNKKNDSLPQYITIQILQGTNIDAVIPIIVLIQEKEVKEIRIVFSPFTAEEFFPPSPYKGIVP